MLRSIRRLSKMASKSPNMEKSGMKTFENLKFDNKALRVLPIDKEKKNFIRPVPNACFSFVEPTKVSNPRMVAYSSDAMQSLLDLSDEEMKKTIAAEYFSGNKILPGSQTAAHCYCGHQFGAFSGQLGDGAAMYLGEVINVKGERWEIQLKGAGPTPYSRHADGRKVLRSSIREFLCSEIMHHLGVPTTRAGTVVTSDSTVLRDKFYDGNAKLEKCSIVLRLAPTFIRFGSFEICKPEDNYTGRSGPSVGNVEILKCLMDYCIESFYPDIWQRHGSVGSEEMYLEWFTEIVKRTAKLVAGWQCVGWCHGVLNTDNMSIMGLTIDYGPFGFMDRYDPHFICNSSDDGGRYTYAKQPEICKWNCEKFAEALRDHVPFEKTQRIVYDVYDEEYQHHYMNTMRKKLGIIKTSNPADKDLVADFLTTMHKTGADFTNSWRALCDLSYNFDIEVAVEKMAAQCCSVEDLREAMKPAMNQRDMQMMIALIQSNPGLLQQLGRRAMHLMRELENMEKLNELQDLTDELKTEKDKTLWREWLTQYQTRLGVDLGDAVSNEAAVSGANSERLKVMRGANPRFVLRNHLAEEAIRLAEEKDFSGVQQLLKAFKHIYGPELDVSESSSCAGASAEMELFNSSYEANPPSWAASLKVS